MNQNIKLIYCFILFFSVFQLGCITSRPHAQLVSQTDTLRGYNNIYKPYYKKKVNGLGSVFCVTLTGTCGYLGYNASSSSVSSGTSNNKALFTAGGALGGYLVSRLFLLIAGNHKITYLDNNVHIPKWISDFNKFNAKDWILVNHPNPNTDSFYVLPKNMENNFIPYNFNDVKNFTLAFPGSLHTNIVIDSVNSKVAKSELIELINIFPQQACIINTKVEYVNRSNDEYECLSAIKRFPETQPIVEAKYASLINSFSYSKDFIERYPNSARANEVFGRIYPKVNYNELENLIDLYPGINKELLSDAKLLFYNQIISIDTVLSKVNKYRDSFYIIQPNNNYEDFESAYSLYNSLKTAASNDKYKNISNLISDLKYQFLVKEFNESKGNKENTYTLFEHVKNDDWIKGGENDSLIQEVISEYCRNFEEEYFTGKKEKGYYQGTGTLFHLNGDIESGEFRDSKLFGKGKVIKSTKEIDEGDFENGELNGEGVITDPTGRVIKGIFINGDLTGKGQINFPDGSYEKGNYYLNSLQGIGERYFVNGNYYKGNFERGRFNGMGEYHWKDKDIWFQGHFTDRSRNGAGTLYLPNGFVAFGDWKNDCLDGKVTIKKDSVQNSDNFNSVVWVIRDCKIISKNTQLEISDFDETLLFEKIRGY